MPTEGCRARWPRQLVVAALLLLVALATPTFAETQVRQGFPAERLPAGWTTTRDDVVILHHRQTDTERAARLLRDALPVRRRLAGLVGPEANEPVEVVLLPARREAAGVPAPDAPDWAAGFTVAGSDVLFIRLDSLGVYPDRDLTSIFAHELGHAVFARLAGSHRLPRWYEEGACMVLARPWDLRDSMTLTVSMLFHTSEPFDRYAEVFPDDAGAAKVAYARSFSFVSWLAEEHGGIRPVVNVARRVGAGYPFTASFTFEYGMTPDQAADLWRTSTGRWYRIVSVLTASTTFWVMVVFLLTLVFLRKRRRNRAVLAQWDQEEGGGGDIPPDPIVPR